MDSQTVLMHYGVKGMRWGVRRSREQLDSASEDASKAIAVKQKISKNRGSTLSLTNEELKTLNERMQLEANYKNLMAKEHQAKADKSKVKQGKKTVDALLDTGRTLTNAYKMYTEVDKIFQPDKYLELEVQKQKKKDKLMKK